MPYVKKSILSYSLPSHHFLDLLMPEEVAFRESPRDIVIDKFEYFFLLSILLKTRILDIGIDHDKILFPLSLKSRGLVLSIGWHVFK